MARMFRIQFADQMDQIAFSTTLSKAIRSAIHIVSSLTVAYAFTHSATVFPFSKFPGLIVAQNVSRKMFVECYRPRHGLNGGATEWKTVQNSIFSSQ